MLSNEKYPKIMLKETKFAFNQREINLFCHVIVIKTKRHSQLNQLQTSTLKGIVLHK